MRRKPEILEGDGGAATIYWHRLNKDSDYELDPILFSTDGMFTPVELSRRITDKQVIRPKAFVARQ